MSRGDEPPRSQTDQGRQVIRGALLGLVVVAILLVVLGSPLLALIPLAIAASCLLFFFGGLGY